MGQQAVPMVLPSPSPWAIGLSDPTAVPSHQVQTGPSGSTWVLDPLTRALGLCLKSFLFEVHIAPYAGTSCKGLLRDQLIVIHHFHHGRGGGVGVKWF